MQQREWCPLRPAWRLVPSRGWCSGLFCFQAEDGIRDGHVTGVQTCALPILATVDGVFDFEQKEDQATFSAENKSLDAILMKASQLGVKKFEAVPPTLEDLFMRHYKG